MKFVDAAVNAAHVAAGGGLTLVLDGISLAIWGIPIAAVSAAGTGALIPELLRDPQPLPSAVRQWLGRMLFALVLTGFVVHVAALERALAIGTAGLLAMFASDLLAIVRGELGPLIGGLRERIVGARKGGDQ